MKHFEICISCCLDFSSYFFRVIFFSPFRGFAFFLCKKKIDFTLKDRMPWSGRDSLEDLFTRNTVPGVAISREHSRRILRRPFRSVLHPGCRGRRFQHFSDTRSDLRLTNYISWDFVTLSPEGSLALLARDV